MLELLAASYAAPKAGLSYVLPLDLQLPPQTCVFLQGDNGVGKTSFLEEILLPKIHKTHDLLYLAQDIELQQTTMLATLALLNQPVPDSLLELIAAWVQAARQCTVLVLDETDKYFGKDLDQALNLSRFSWVFTVSHMDLQAAYHSMQHGYALDFQRSQKQLITLGVEKLW